MGAEPAVDLVRLRSHYRGLIDNSVLRVPADEPRSQALEWDSRYVYFLFRFVVDFLLAQLFATIGFYRSRPCYAVLDSRDSRDELRRR